MTFKQALKRLPRCAEGNFDFLSHKTIADLRFIVRHELDLWEEGQETDIRTAQDVAACRRFLDQIHP